MGTVLVTGGSGFLGSHCIVRLLQAGHAVRATVRNLARETEVRAMVRQGGASVPLSVVAADLGADTGWAEAVQGCDHVLHVASPFVTGTPEHEDDLIVPARDGTLRVLAAARAAGVRRVVMTSSFAAIGYGHGPRAAAFTEADWTDTTQPDVEAYIKSKTVAERAAWDFMAREGGPMELAVINPTGIFGPVLGPDLSVSVEMVRALLEGRMLATPRIFFGVVDVRDVAELNLRAMTAPRAAGERFIAVAGEPMSLHDVARTLRDALGPAAARVPRFELPDLLVRLLAVRAPQMRRMLPQLGKRRRASAAKARSVLDWVPRPNEEVIAATGRSLLELGLIRDRPDRPRG